MTPNRLLVPVLLLCPAFLFAQENLQKASPTDDHLLASSSQNSFSAPRMDPLGATPSQVQQDPLAQVESSFRFKSNQNKSLLSFPAPSPDSVISPAQVADGMCYSIRSYVVARDSKHSDSVHPVGSSTCIPAHKVQLKSATGSAQTVQLGK